MRLHGKNDGYGMDKTLGPSLQSQPEKSFFCILNLKNELLNFLAIETLLYIFWLDFGNLININLILN